MVLKDMSEQDFGRAPLGDPRRNKRLMKMVRRLEERPSGKVSDVYVKADEREGSYRFLESDKFENEALDLSRATGCAERMEAHGGVIVVPVDQTSLHMHDHTGAQGFGSVGTRRAKARGVHVITALALTEQGVPLGILGQEYFVRREERSPIRKAGSRRTLRDRRPQKERESHHLLLELERARAVAAEHAPSTAVWWQSDRGGDCWIVFDWAREHQALLTVRLAQNRTVQDACGKRMLLKQWLGKRSLHRFEQTLHVAADPEAGRRAREARMRVLYGEVELVLKVGKKRRRFIKVTVIDIKECRPPRGQKPIHWRLATTYPVRSDDDVSRTLRCYALRWRIEDFHRAWKTGSCNIESSQLRSPRALERWGILTSTMTVRAENLKCLSRQTPDTPASLVFTREEIDIMITWRLHTMPKAYTPYQPGDDPPVEQLVLWIAIMGGYNGPRGRPRPGTVVIARGLDVLEGMVLGMRVTRLLDAHRSG